MIEDAASVRRLPAVMRKSIDGLCAIVLNHLKTEPDGCSIIFCGKRCDRIKIFLHEPDGFVLLLNVLMWYEEGAAGQKTGGENQCTCFCISNLVVSMQI